ncbi:hypothetical protein, partial [Kitasatospora sp. NPDC007106]|uniref:hypothetical protein n=1 Tax=Kitasatospora sp. NPDC007106 TaxID=3156914 RepID=UPI0033ED33A9
AGLRQQLARWFGRGDTERERAELERLDRTEQALDQADGEEAERERIRQEASWQARIENMLESLDDQEREKAAASLRALLARALPDSPTVSAAAGGVAAGGDITATADHGSIAAAVIEGGAQIGTSAPASPTRGEGAGPERPPVPDPSRG